MYRVASCEFIYVNKRTHTHADKGCVWSGIGGVGGGGPLQHEYLTNGSREALSFLCDVPLGLWVSGPSHAITGESLCRGLH